MTQVSNNLGNAMTALLDAKEAALAEQTTTTTTAPPPPVITPQAEAPITPEENPTAPPPPPVVAPTEQKAATETPAAAVVTPSAKSLEGLLYNEPSSTTENQTTAPVATEADIQRKLSDYEALMANPVVKNAVEFAKTNMSWESFVKEYTPTDYTKMSSEDLIAAYGKDAGWSEEDIQAEIATYETKSRFEKDNLRSQLQGALNAKQQGKYEQLIANGQRASEAEQALLQKSIDNIDRMASALPGMDLFGAINLTDKHRDEFKDFATTFDQQMMKADGTFDEKFILNAYIGNKLLPQIHRALLATGKSLGIVEVLKEVQRPSIETPGQSRLPESVNTPADPRAAAMEALNQIRGRASTN